VVAANAIGLGVDLVHPEIEFGGFLGAVDRYGPPLFTSIAVAVTAWNPHAELTMTFGSTMLRLAVWAVAGIALLLALFRRREIES
jgi:hypothetical protein